MRQIPGGIRTIQFLLLTIVGLISLAVLIYPLSLSPGALSLEVGDVAPQNFQAPEAIEYVSEVRTEDAKLVAESAVQPVYSLPDPSIARGQIERLRDGLNYISLVRNDEYASPEQKSADIASMSDVTLSSETIQSILDLSPARWDNIQQESLSVLEQVMRNTIREENLSSVKRSVPSLVSLALSEEQAGLVSELVIAFVVPNSIYSPELTDSARQAAREGVEPVVQTYKAGEMVLAAGQVVSPSTLEALEKMGLIEPGPQWQDYLGSIMLVVTNTVMLGLYFFRQKHSALHEIRNLILITILFVIFILGARLLIPNRTVVPYLYPLPAFGLLLATLFNRNVGLIFSIVASVLATYGLPNSLDLTPYFLLSSLIGVMVLGPAQRIWAFLRAGVAIAGTGIAMIFAFRVPFVQMDLIGTVTLLGAAVFNGLASASLTLLLQYFLAQALGLTTAMQLLEISRPDSPLLQYFLRNAPGTYQHSLQVANLAEQAAESIGADALLTRVGALFHDIGKAKNPTYFIENQGPGQVNTHDDMAPNESSKTITQHVLDGIALARKYRLPRRINDFILEHHGTMITRYQYSKAVEAAGGDESKVDTEDFRYPGPRPSSRETALLMLADGAEARVRAKRPQNEEELREIIREAINHAQETGQLDNTQLTLQDLSTITNSFVHTLSGTYHARIEYPKIENESAIKNARTVPREDQKS